MKDTILKALKAQKPKPEHFEPTEYAARLEQWQEDYAAAQIALKRAV